MGQEAVGPSLTRSSSGACALNSSFEGFFLQLAADIY